MNEFKEQEESYKFFKYADQEPGEEVVISGIAGRFPKSNNLYELKDNIFNRKDCITDNGINIEHSEIPRRTGKINNIEKFDALFFDVDFKEAHTMDPMGRILFEHTYEAIVDAGIHPKDLRGTRTGVFLGSCFSDTEKTWFYDKLQVNGFGIISCSKAFMASRISHWLGVTGPTYNVDTACSSSLFAMEHAYRAIHNGQCDYAIVAGSNLCLHPFVTLQFKRLGILSEDGRCKCFDEDADGYVRSDAVVVAFLQKGENAKRIYATVIHAKTNCDGYKEQGITFPSSQIQSTLLKEFYDECGVPTACINYIEAHGTGTKVGDPEEINAIDQIFTKNRNNPLKVGSIKSNLGHTEPASGMCSIAKAIISMESGLIPPNINLNRLRKDVKAFTEGRIMAVTETSPLDGEYIGINSFGFGGANAHVLLKSNQKTKVNKGLPDDDLPRLVTVSGRTEEAVVTILNDIDNRPIDVEFIRLLHDIHLKETSSHLCRGYTITSSKSSDEKLREIENYSGIKKPILFVFSGMGSHCSGIGQSLMRFPIFAKAIEKCDAILKQYKLNIYKILTEKDNSMFDNILHSIVGIAAVQIGLVDLLTSVGVVPDYIIGHSVGELGCAYADGCFTAEEMILAAYSRGIALMETEISHGSMATVGLSYEDLKNCCPVDIDIACHNGTKSTTVSGPTDSVKKFVKKLQATEVIVEEVACNNIPYHSRYIAAVGSKLFVYLKKVIPVAKARSEKWLSTSVPRNAWSTSAAKLSSAEYHTNNLLKPVLFAESLALIPNNVVTIEIGSQNLLQATLRKSLQPTVRNIALNHRNDKDNVIIFLQALGKIYNSGIQLDLAKLYPHVEYPVSRDVPVQLFEDIDVIVTEGVEIHNIRASEIVRKKPVSDPIIEEHKFIAYRDRREMSLREILTLSMHITLENIPMMKVKTIELVEDNDNISAEKLVSPLFRDILANLPSIQASINLFAPPKKFDEEDILKNVEILESTKLRTDDVAILAVGCCLLTNEKKDSLKQLLKSTKDGAFLLSREKENITLDFSILKEFQLGIVLEKRTSEESWILLRKIKKISKYTQFINVRSNEFNWLKEVQNVLANETQEDNMRVILFEERNFESGLLGFINCLQKEPGGKIFRAVLIQDLKAPKFSLELSLYSEQLETDLVINVLRPGNVWGSYRHQLLPSGEPKLMYHAIVNQLSRGDLSSLRWLEGPITKDYQKEDLVRIHYASLNFKDVMLATGKIGLDMFQQNRKNIDNVLGFEYSGISTGGRRIMGLNPNKCISNLCQMDKIFSWTVPESWSLEDAATVPCVYSTCVAALYINGEIKKGDRILIHSGAGGVGQAAITLALHEGCEIFTTVGTPEKRNFIKETFPSIDDNHIGNSRDTSFEEMILQETDGRGVDIVLNSLAEEKLLASLRCLAYRGRFLEIGKFDLAANNLLDIDAFTKEISFHAIMLDQIIVTKDGIRNEISSKVNKLLKENAIKPIVRTIFGRDQVEKAFRFMAAGKHIGKILIKIREEDKPLNTPILAEPYYTCYPNKSYIIIGGLGGFGLELIDWLVLRNATNIVITSRNGIKNGYQQMRIKRWESYGVNIKILVGLDAAKQEDCELVVKSAIDQGPIDGIFNLAVSLKDCICSNQTMKTFEECFKGKAWATKRLDEVTRKLCPNLRHFVVFSSVSCGRGNAGQTNYGMANSVMERICEKRVEEGLPGLAIQWGAIGDVGLVADMQDDDKELVIGGTLQQKITSCLKEMNRFLLQDKPIVASMIVAEKRLGADNEENVVNSVLKIMCIKDLNSFNPHTSLAELGMDSMMGIEIKQTLEREYEIYLNAEDIRSLSFAKLMKMNNKLSGDSNHIEIATDKILFGTNMLMQLYGEKLSSDLIVSLKTKPEEGRSEIFFIPGIEGYGIIFKTLESKIKSPATCFQLGINYELETIEEMAHSFLPHILEKLKDRKDFTLVGYSFGSLVTIELTRQLETKGFKGRLILIDGAPQLMKEIVNEQFQSSSEEELQNKVFVIIAKTLTSVNIEQFILELEKSKTWDEKVNAFFNVLSPIHKQLYLERDQKNAILSFYVRLHAIMKYNPEPIPYIRTPIILFKPMLSSVKHISYDYGLQKITEGKVEVHVIDGNHATMLENDEIAMVINHEPLKRD
ncbi:fatty acid synthase-like isoform X2 [Vespa mandarinia]|uniref:fatty acid synthase-like isoform X2 n=1 Tax=Vespa mandarinia TaxID=7446 RepID=UPI001620C8EE|nr:fatty acid synthase-like isoform X2 [Vespa mandarinia]